MKYILRSYLFLISMLCCVCIGEETKIIKVIGEKSENNEPKPLILGDEEVTGFVVELSMDAKTIQKIGAKSVLDMVKIGMGGTTGIYDHLSEDRWNKIKKKCVSVTKSEPELWLWLSKKKYIIIYEGEYFISQETYEF